jgi:ABC-type siderophore export system fused ATPase/permease subunit
VSRLRNSHHYSPAPDLLLPAVQLSPGELVFLVGSNGSGKTTLAKLLIGLYSPESGEIRFAAKPVTRDGLALYREQFSVVFSDFFVFQTLYGLGAERLDADAHRYLSRLLLPELKARGKTVVVITHDDRYFHLADRIVKLDSGQVAASWSQAEFAVVHGVPEAASRLPVGTSA